MSTDIAQPTALDVVKKTLHNLKKIGSPSQQREAVEIERQLDEQATAACFVRRGRQPKPEGKS